MDREEATSRTPQRGFVFRFGLQIMSAIVLLIMILLIRSRARLRLLMLIEQDNRRNAKRGHVGGVSGRPHKRRRFSSPLNFASFQISEDTADKEYEQTFRVPRSVVSRLVRDLAVELTPPPRSRRDSVQPQECILLALSMLGTTGFCLNDKKALSTR